ncbi:serine/threonine-protein kinase [Streptomyces sp. WAC06614]|uniref:serine/threonine-protein kinase n=1 Tax=Streptomyces sp. WAC06614 TaxID=2487416 RepID=UPI00163CF4FC|nr:serine/threonine-protein kinase [Streptomyces sp. WAC06614]
MRADHAEEGRRDVREPSRIGPYEVLGQLGAGGMGEVYLARSDDGQRVAVKRIRPDVAADPGYRARFRREVLAARAVSGICTPPVVGADADAEHPWLASVFVEGPDLSDVVRHGPGPLAEAPLRSLAAALATALVSIHRAGLVHRDLKPGNVLMTAAGPQVIDFGIAKALAPGFTQLTPDGRTVGTPAYMSPEQAMARSVTPASDVFALGCVLIFAATGRHPFQRDHEAAVMHAVVFEDPDLDGVPDSLRPLVEACVEKQPEHRPTPEALLAMLAETGQFSLHLRTPVPPGRPFVLLTAALALYFCAFLGAAAVRHDLPMLIPLIVIFGWLPPVVLMASLHRLRRVEVVVGLDDWGVRLRYGNTSVAQPWEELKEVELVQPAVARVPAKTGDFSLVAVMRPGHPGTQPLPLRLRPGNRVGLNLRLTPQQAAALRALLARRRARDRAERS